MINKKLRISIEIEDNWSRGDFRIFVKYLLSIEAYDVYIISNNDIAADITRIGESLGMESDHIIVCNFTDDKLQAIVNNNINIHFDNLQSFIMLLETTDAEGILVSGKVNKYYAKQDYLVVFDNVLEEIRRRIEET